MREDISDILNSNLAKKGLLKAAKSARVCAVALELARGRFEVVSFRDGALKILVNSSAVAHLIKLEESKLIAQINQKLDSESVKKIIFTIA